MELLPEELVLELCHHLEFPEILWRLCKSFRSSAKLNEVILDKISFKKKEFEWLKKTGLRFGYYFRGGQAYFHYKILTYNHKGTFRIEQHDGCMINGWFDKYVVDTPYSAQSDKKVNGYDSDLNLIMYENKLDVFTVRALHQYRVKKLLSKDLVISSDYVKKQTLQYLSHQLEKTKKCSRLATYYYLKMRRRDCKDGQWFTHVA